MADTKGNIRARKLGNTGITEDILAKIANAKGGHVLAIIDLKADTIHEQVEGDDRTVDFLIETIEPVVDGKLNGALVDHVRDIHAALHRNRMLAENGPQLPLDGAPQAPTNEEVLAAGAGVIGRDDEGPVILHDPDDELHPDIVAASKLNISGDLPEDWEYESPEGADTKTVDDPFAIRT